MSDRLFLEEQWYYTTEIGVCYNCIHYFPSQRFSGARGTCLRFPKYKNKYADQWCGEFNETLL